MIQNQSKYLFLLDGYDELKAPKNIYVTNNMARFGKGFKMIVTSREEYLRAFGNYQKYFKTNQKPIFEHRISDVTKY